MQQTMVTSHQENPILLNHSLNMLKHAERVPKGLKWVVQSVYDGEEWVNRCENYYLTRGITKESEMADIEGSTATDAPL
jgi:hypothetical protein